VLGFALESTGDALRRAVSGIRDAFFANNSEWKYIPPALSAHGRKHSPIPPFTRTDFDDEIEQRAA